MKKITLLMACFFTCLVWQSNAQYCTPLVDNCNFESITNVSFGSIDITSGCDVYSDNTAEANEINLGATQQVSVTVTTDSQDYLYVFIDWNQNDVLDDAGEVYTLASDIATDGTYSTDVTVPGGAALGDTRMRVLIGYTASTPDPCAIPLQFGARFGEVEDYTVTVNDVVGDPPVIVCVPDQMADTDPGECSAIVNFSNAIALDTEDGEIETTQTMGPPSGSMFPTGDTLIEFTAEDSDGNVETCQFTVTVTDMEAPEAVCQNLTLEVDPISGSVSIVPEDIDNGSSDNCGIVDYSLDVDTFTCADTGDNEVTLTVTDEEGNSSSCTATVTIEDNTAPDIVCIGQPATLTDSASDSPNAAIPDNDPTGGLTTTITISDDFEITDLNVGLEITHTWVGDITATLTSPSGTSVVIFDRPGVPASSVGCGGDNVSATLDDEATDPVEDECENLPAIGGSFMPSNPLSAFDGESTMGDWTLNVTDSALLDSGSLDTWSLTYEYEVTATPYEVELDADGNATISADELIQMPVNEACGYTVTVGGPATAGGPPQVLETSLTSDNSFNGNWFDITAINDITINSFDVNLATGVTDDVAVYYKTGSYVGFEQDSSAWTLLDTAMGITSNGTDVATPLNLNLGQVVNAGETVAFHVTTVNGGTMNYINGTTAGTLFASDANLEIYEGAGGSGPFGPDVFSPRNFSGNILYKEGLPIDNNVSFDCSNLGENEVEVFVTDDSGNFSSCIATVNVSDVTAPVLVCNSETTIELGEDGTTTIDPMELLATAETTYNAMVIGGDNGSFAEGSTDFTVEVTEDVTVSFDWDYTTDDTLAGFDSFGYLLNGTYNQLTDDTLLNQSGSESVTLVAGDIFGFRTLTDDNFGGASTATVTNFMPGFTGQFDQANWNLELTNSDGDAFFVEIPGGPLSFDACGIDVLAVDITEVSCADIGTPITVTVFASDASGNIASCTSTVNVVDTLAPVVTCPEDQTVDPGEGNLFYEVPDYFATGEGSALDNCTDPVTITSQDPAPGELIGDGDYTVTLTAEDEYGNVGTCTFQLTVESVLGVNDNELSTAIAMYPNPANNQVTISNKSNIALQNAVIYDINGKLINQYDLRNMQGEQIIDVSALASGVYVVQITSDKSSVTKRLIKK